ncbi:unnamed protein product [Macrosiphum euphorbiae]|uniref:Uncharacterized protein n=1 Tax=Macrosiphum euphorbiae TaxID=13131 RepID=A0AAV0XV84_9HEMI|nr:unnamed protein product [Macrosiphum euphorbiae]
MAVTESVGQKRATGSTVHALRLTADAEHWPPGAKRPDDAQRTPQTDGRKNTERALSNVTSTCVFRRLEDVENLLEHSISRPPYTE